MTLVQKLDYILTLLEEMQVKHAQQLYVQVKARNEAEARADRAEAKLYRISQGEGAPQG